MAPLLCTEGAASRRHALVVFAGVFAGALLAATSCGRAKDHGPATAASTAASSAPPSASTPAPGPSTSAASGSAAGAPAIVDPVARLAWRELVAAGAWEHAARALDALPEGDRATVAARLARLRVSTGRCTKEDGARGVALAEGLAGAPDVPPELLARLRVDALICAERFAEAVACVGPGSLASRKGAASGSRQGAALAATRARVLEGAGDLSGARAAYADAIDGAPRAGLPTGTLVAARLRLLRRLPASPEIERAIEADRTRLFVEHPPSFEAATKAGEPPFTVGQGAVGQGTVGKGAPTLDAEGWLKRADALATLARVEDAQHAIDAAASAGASKKRVARARGHALWKARSYAKAAPALREASALEQGEDAIEDAFLAARATSRAGDDDAAIAAYEALAKKHPGSRFGGEAAYLAAHLRWLRGSWKDAIAAFDRYLAGPWARAPHQKVNVREARRARAIALLESGRAADARRTLHALAGGDVYADDATARGRIELLEAIAVERSGDRAAAIAAYARLSRVHPFGWLDLAARARLLHLGEPSASWPKGPVPAPSLPAMPAEVRALFFAGMSSDALDRFVRAGLPKDDAPRCATLEALDDGWGAYRIGLRFAVDDPPGPANAGGAPSFAWKWRCAWPSPYGAVVGALEAREGLPRGLLHSILRQESAFQVEVVSPAGAVGIAQLMPATAVETASAIGLHLDPTDLASLQAPFLQLDLAARHLRALFVELTGPGASDADRRDALPLVVAAYNAGAGSVKRWMREAGTMDADVFVERTPYLETRGYVARVLGNAVRYAVIEGAPTPTLPRKLPAPPP